MYTLKMNDKNFESNSQTSNAKQVSFPREWRFFARPRISPILLLSQEKQGHYLGLRVYGEKLPRVGGLPAFLS